MTGQNNTIVELVTYNRFKRPRKGKPQGMALLKIVDGLTVNYVTELVFGYHLDSNGEPDLDNFAVLSDIEYDLSSEVSVCLHFLRDNEWLNSQAEIVTTIDDKAEHDVRISNWRKSPQNINSISAFMADVALEMTYGNQSFSQTWYCAKICELYYQRYPVEPNAVLTIGILLSQMWWKLVHEAAALNHYAAEERRRKAAPKGAKATEEKYAKLRERCLDLLSIIYAQNEAFVLGASIQPMAEKLRAVALGEFPDIFIAPNGKPLSKAWFVRTLEDFQSDGQLSAKIKAIVSG